MPISTLRSPLENCRGTRPTQAARCRPFLNSDPSPIAATIAVAGLRADALDPGNALTCLAPVEDAIGLFRRARKLVSLSSTRPLAAGDELLVNDHRVKIVGRSETLPRFPPRPLLYIPRSPTPPVPTRSSSMPTASSGAADSLTLATATRSWPCKSRSSILKRGSPALTRSPHVT
jgi:hypothetical protein